MHRNNRHQQPKQKKNIASKPYVPITSVYEQVRPFITISSRSIFDLSIDYLSILEQMSEDELVKAIKNTSPKSTEFKALFERLQPHQRRALLEERALHEYSASAADANTGGYDGGGPPRFVSTDSDVQAYYTALLAAGSTISVNNIQAVQTAVLDLKGILPNSTNNPSNFDIWTPIKLLGLMTGFTGYQGCLVPLKNTVSTTLVNHGFSSSDYTPTVGLKGDGTSKYIDFGISDTTVFGTTRHYLFWKRNNASQGNGAFFGNQISVGTNNCIRIAEAVGTGTSYNDTTASATTDSSALYNDNFIGAIRAVSGASGARVYPGNIVLTAAGTNGSGNNLFMYTDGTTYSNDTFALYSIGDRLQAIPANQTSRYIIYKNIVTTLLASLT